MGRWVVIGGGSSFLDLRDPRRRRGCLSVKHSAKPGSQDCQGDLTVERGSSVSLGPGCDGGGGVVGMCKRRMRMLETHTRAQTHTLVGIDDGAG